MLVLWKSVSETSTNIDMYVCMLGNGERPFKITQTGNGERPFVITQT